MREWQRCIEGAVIGAVLAWFCLQGAGVAGPRISGRVVLNWNVPSGVSGVALHPSWWKRQRARGRKIHWTVPGARGPLCGGRGMTTRNRSRANCGPCKAYKVHCTRPGDPARAICGNTSGHVQNPRLTTCGNCRRSRVYKALIVGLDLPPGARVVK